MIKVTHVIRGTEGFIDGLLISSDQKAKYLFKGQTVNYTHKVQHPTQPNVFGAVFDVYPDGVSAIWDIVKSQVLNPSHLGKLEVYTDEWKNIEE